MVDEKNNEVLKALVALCKDTDSFKILDAEEIISQCNGVDKDSLSVAIKEISDREMIKIKYANKDEYCLAILPKAKIEDDAIVAGEGVAQKKGVAGKFGQNWSLKKAVFVSALSGSFLGGLIVAIINLAIQFI